MAHFDGILVLSRSGEESFKKLSPDPDHLGGPS